MNKIPTLFKRDWGGNGGVINEYVFGTSPIALKYGIATEKLDGTNVRVTVRNHQCVRLEKRRNPTKDQKVKGIIEPWYIDANAGKPEDKWIFDALSNTNLSSIPDGKWSGEAIGKNIQGNPLNLDKNTIIFLNIKIRLPVNLQPPIFENVPIDYQGLKEWLPKQRSKIGNGCGIEGIVWHSHRRVAKIKVRDFK